MKKIISHVLSISLLFIASFTISAQSDSEGLRDTYDFDYVYKIEMASKKDKIQFDYYLKKDAGYFGFDLPVLAEQKDGMKVFTVMDTENNITGMYMEMMGRKILKKSKLKLSDFDVEDDSEDYSIRKIDPKTILGYNCDGYIMENKDNEMTVYITNEAPVSFNNVFSTDKKKMPKGFNPSWMKKYAENGLMMEMHYVDKKKPKNNMTMTCVALEETDFTLDGDKYGSMLSTFGG